MHIKASGPEAGHLAGMDTRKLAPRFAIASAILFVTLVAMQILTGASQAYFEVVHPPATYAARMIAHAAWFRIIVALDNVFIASYVGAFVFGALAFPRRAVTWLVLGSGILVGLLDLEENHHMLALLHAAEDGLPIAVGDLVRRMDLSSTKFGLAHLAGFFLALLVPGRSATARALRAICFVQLPLGMAGIVWDGAIPLQLARAASLTAVYLLLAAVIARPGFAAREVGSDVPA
jgi:hypothetical protein